MLQLFWFATGAVDESCRRHAHPSARQDQPGRTLPAFGPDIGPAQPRRPPGGRRPSPRRTVPEPENCGGPIALVPGARLLHRVLAPRRRDLLPPERLAGRRQPAEQAGRAPLHDVVCDRPADPHVDRAGAGLRAHPGHRHHYAGGRSGPDQLCAGERILVERVLGQFIRAAGDGRPPLRRQFLPVELGERDVVLRPVPLAAAAGHRAQQRHESGRRACLRLPRLPLAVRSRAVLPDLAAGCAVFAGADRIEPRRALSVDRRAPCACRPSSHERQYRHPGRSDVCRGPAVQRALPLPAVEPAVSRGSRTHREPARCRCRTSGAVFLHPVCDPLPLDLPGQVPACLHRDDDPVDDRPGVAARVRGAVRRYRRVRLPLPPAVRGADLPLAARSQRAGAGAGGRALLQRKVKTAMGCGDLHSCEDTKKAPTRGALVQYA